MKLLIEIPTRMLLVDVAGNTGAFIKGIVHAKVVDSKWEGMKYVYVPADGHIEFKVVDDSLLEKAPEPLQELQEKLRKSESRQVEYYNKATGAEKKLADLEKHIRDAGITLSDQKEA